MGPTTKKPSGKKPPNDPEALKSEVASFASSLGLASSAPSSGFDDSDFRKSGPIKPTSKPEKPAGRPDKAQVAKPRAGPKPTPKSLPFRDEDQSAALSRKNDRYRSLPKLPLVKASSLGLWYEDAGELERKVLGEGYGGKLDVKMGVEEWKRFVEGKREVGDRLMYQYSQDYEAGRGQSGDIKMLVATQRSGTAADKVSAFSVLLGDNPLANLRALDALLGMVTSKVGKRHALTGFEALKELFVSSLLPDRKLKTLLQRPLNNLPETKDGYSLLLFWYWEDCLKQRYERFVFALEEASRDMLPILKDKALKTIYSLLKSKSEQERRLLSALVNKVTEFRLYLRYLKLGDPQNRSASNADFHLANLLSDHPNMKAVVIDEVDTFLFRPHLGLRAKYHAVNFLSQIRLSHKGDGPKVAKRLVDVYFALFKVLINEADNNQKVDKIGNSEDKNDKVSKKSEVKTSPDSHIELDSRILSALLTGVNRAFPYVSSDEADDVIEAHTPMLFRLVHSDNFNVGIQALMLLDKLSSKNQTVSDRFYRALYSKLLLPAAVNSSKSELFIGLLLRAMKNDVNLKRVSAFAKRLLQVALQQPPQYACGCLFVLSELLKARPPLWNMVLQNESVDEDIEHFEDITEEIDNTSQEAPKKEQEKPLLYNADLQSKSSENDQAKGFSSDDDASDGDDMPIEDSSKVFVESKSLSNHHQAQAPSTVNSLAGGYNPRHREPSFCNADRASWWELTVLASHAHPSVATMAGTLLSGANIVYNGNPLNDLSLTAFLDKFMEKKPKQTEWHGGSQIEPAKQLDISNHLIGPEILSLAEVDVPPEDLVFHKFYVNKMSSTKQNKKKKKKKPAEEEAAEELFDVDDPEEVGGDESDNEEIENMLDSANITFEEEDGGYDYDDLDKVVDEDDDDLVGDASDEEVDVPSDIAEEEDFDGMVDGSRANDPDSDEDGVNIGEGDDIDDSKIKARKGKRKSRAKSGVSPFASLEDYEHLINEDDDKQAKEKPSKSEKHKPRKKKKKRSSE